MEPLVKDIDIDGAFFFLLLVDGSVDSDLVGRFDSHVASVPVLLGQLSEGDGGHARVRVSLLVRGVRDQLCDILFKLSKVVGDVALVEARVLVIVHNCRHSWGELGPLEVKNELFAEQVQLAEVLLLIVDFGSGHDDAVSERLVVVLHLSHFLVEVVVVKLRHLLVHGDLGVIVAVRLLKLVVFLV